MVRTSRLMEGETKAICMETKHLGRVRRSGACPTIRTKQSWNTRSSRDLTYRSLQPEVPIQARLTWG
jgi:hypothetical protein